MDSYDGGQHRHECPVCDQTWWHDDTLGRDACEEVWTWECPIDIGVGRESVEDAA